MKRWLAPYLIFAIWWVAEWLLRASTGVDNFGAAVTRWANR